MASIKSSRWTRSKNPFGSDSRATQPCRAFIKFKATFEDLFPPRAYAVISFRWIVSSDFCASIRVWQLIFIKRNPNCLSLHMKNDTQLSLGSVEYCSWSPRDVHRLCDYCVGTLLVKCAFVSTKHAKTHYILVDIHRFSCVSKIQRFYANTTRMKASRM